MKDSLLGRIKRSFRLGRAMRLVWESSPKWTVLRCGLLVVQGLLPLVSLYLLKLILDAVSENLAAESGQGDFGPIALFIGIAGGVSLITALLGSVGELVAEMHAHVVTEHMASILHTKSVGADLEFYENSAFFDSLHRAQSEAGFRPTRILNGLAQILRSGISLLGVAGLLLAFHWMLTLVLFASMVPGLLVRMKHSSALYRWQRQRTETERRTRYFDLVLTHPNTAKELRLFGLGDAFQGRFRALRKQLIQEQFEISSRRCRGESATHVGSNLAIFGSFAFIAWKASERVISLGGLVMYYQAFQRGQGFMRDLMRGLGGLYEDNLFLTSLEEFLDLEPKIVAPAEPKPLPDPVTDGFRFEGVGFKYPAGEREVLRDVSLVIPRGKMTALVGENGSGKTTLVKLLCRLYDPDSGAVTLDGENLRAYEPTALRHLISVVFQDYGQYAMKAWENIWLGDAGHEPDRDRIEAMARMAGVHDAISKLSRGYDSELGKMFAGGEELSIGEWQMVALARAYLRDAEIMVLDEPTSALDAKAEYEVFRHLQQLAENRTSVVISHRFSTVRMADCIHVLDGGAIVESGTHDELMSLEGMYAGLFRTQAQYYT